MSISTSQSCRSGLAHLTPVKSLERNRSSSLEQPIAFAVETDAFDAQPASRRPGCRGGRALIPKRNLILVLSTAGPLHRSARR
jgi:hypothetical protein